MTLLQWGTEEQKERILTPQAKGEKNRSIRLNGTQCRLRRSAMNSTAVKDGDSYILNGSKHGFLYVITPIIFSYLPTRIRAPATKDYRHLLSIGTWMVFSSKAIKEKLGIRAGNTGEIFFEDIKVPKENLIGEEGEGFKIAMSALDNGRSL